MSETVCPSCGASFMTPWPQCPICGSAIPTSAAAPEGPAFPSAPDDSGEPFVPPAYDSPIPAAAPAKKKSGAPDFSVSDISTSLGESNPFGDFGDSAAPAAPPMKDFAPPGPAPSTPAASAPAGGLDSSTFNFDPDAFSAKVSSSAPTFPTDSANDSASGSTSSLSPPSLGGGSSFGGGDDEQLGIDPSSFKSFDFTALDPTAAPPAPPASSGAAAGAGSNAPASAASASAPPAFRGGAPGLGAPGPAVPPAFRNPTAPGMPPLGSAMPPGPVGPPPTEGSSRSALDAPSSFADLTTPGARTAARRVAPQIRPQEASRVALPGEPGGPPAMNDEALSTAGLAPTRTDDRSLTERALERQKGQAEQKQRTGLATLLLVTIFLLLTGVGVAFAILKFKTPSVAGTGAIGTPGGTGVLGASGTTTGQAPATAVTTSSVNVSPTKIDEETTLMVGNLTSGPEEVRRAASKALADKGALAVPALIPVLNHSDPNVRALAVDSLGEIGASAGAAVPALLASFDEGPLLVQARCAPALSKIGGAAAAGLAERYKPKGQHNVRLLVVSALDGMGPAAEPAKQTLVAALGDDSETVREIALRSLKKIGPPAFDDVRNALTAKLAVTRQAACEYMSNQGGAAIAAAPDLIDRLADDAERVRDYAQHALGRMGPGVVSPLIVAMKESDDANVRTRIALALGRVGEPALTPLVEVLNSTQPSTALYAAQALGEMGPRAKEALPSLESAAKRGDGSLKFYAVEAIRNIKN